MTENDPLNPQPALPVATPPAPPFLQRITPAGFAVFSLCLVFVVYQFLGGGIVLLLSGGKVTVENTMLVRWATMGGEILCILIPTIALARMRGLSPVGFFRLRVPRTGEIILTVIAVFALQQVLQGYMALQDAIPLPPTLQKIVEAVRAMYDETYRILVAAHSPQEFIFVVLVVAVVPAVAEETLFRGLVQRSFEESMGGMRSAVLTGVIFAAYHLNPFEVIPLAALGMYFGFIAYRSRTIGVAITAHFFNNFVACAASYFRLNEDFIAAPPGAAVTPAAIALDSALFILVFVAATYYYIRITDHSKDSLE